jgi:hypothetical protein
MEEVQPRNKEPDPPSYRREPDPRRTAPGGRIRSEQGRRRILGVQDNVLSIIRRTCIRVGLSLEISGQGFFISQILRAFEARFRIATTL